jgi:RHS repeat-associated protein
MEARVQDYILAGKSFIAKINANGTFYFVGDRLSERLRLDSNGNVAAQGGHLPFGEDFAETGGVEKHHFTSYERDNETGADYAVNRLYSSGVGRFTAVDRLSSSAKPGRPQTLNRYTYSSGDPVNLVDPTGLDAFSSGAGGGVDESNPCPDGFYYIGTFLTDAGEETDCGYDPVPGGGDPGEPPPPTCKGFAENTEGHFFSDTIPLNFNDGSRREGTAGFGYGSKGWYINTLIGFMVSDDVANWDIHQSGLWVGSGTAKNPTTGQFLSIPLNDPRPHDEPKAGNWVQNAGDLNLYWIDNPGLPIGFFYWSQGFVPWNYTAHYDVTSSITSRKGGATCTVTWHVYLEWKDGNITTWKGTTDNPPQF